MKIHGVQLLHLTRSSAFLFITSFTYIRPSWPTNCIYIFVPSPKPSNRLVVIQEIPSSLSNHDINNNNSPSNLHYMSIIFFITFILMSFLWQMERKYLQVAVERFCHFRNHVLYTTIRLSICIRCSPEEVWKSIIIFNITISLSYTILKFQLYLLQNMEMRHYVSYQGLGV